MPNPETMRVKPTHPDSQGEHVEINKADFDPKIHEAIDKNEIPADVAERRMAEDKTQAEAHAKQPAHPPAGKAHK